MEGKQSRKIIGLVKDPLESLTDLLNSWYFAAVMEGPKSLFLAISGAQDVCGWETEAVKHLRVQGECSTKMI